MRIDRVFLVSILFVQKKIVTSIQRVECMDGLPERNSDAAGTDAAERRMEVMMVVLARGQQDFVNILRINRSTFVRPRQRQEY